MLLPLLCLCAISLMSGTEAAPQVITQNTVVNIQSCPINYYGIPVTNISVTFDTTMSLCMNGLTSECIVNSRLSFPLTFNISTSKDAGSQLNWAIRDIADFNYTCTLSFTSSSETINIYKYGPICAAKTSRSTLSFKRFGAVSRGSSTRTLTYCRYGSTFKFRERTIETLSSTCTTVICTKSGEVESLSYCSANSRCRSGSCVAVSVCTVSGSSLIDVSGVLRSIEDRCRYSLLSVAGNTIQVEASFQERRRRDVSLLDSVTVRMGSPPAVFRLEQGGRVLLNGSVLRLNETARNVHGLALSKDQDGVTAEFRSSTTSAAIFFDGNTVQLSIEASSQRSLNGLCLTGPVDQQRLSVNSSCRKSYVDAADQTINCTAVGERCNLLKEAPSFAACQGLVNPQPYFDACNKTLCQYPAVDGLGCQFLEAYARACKATINHSAEAWRTKASCPTPRAFCPDRTCSAHEFCGEKSAGGETSCFCRAVFSSKYKAAMGDPAVCGVDSTSISLAGCLLEEKGINYSTLHLKDKSCKGHMDSLTHMVTFSFNNSHSCGSEVTANDTKVVYQNTIMAGNTSGVITRQDQFSVNFSCIQDQPKTKMVAFRIRDSSVVQQITSGPWNYTLTMKAYTDAQHKHGLQPNTKVQLNQKIWLELKTTGLDGNLVVLVTDSCWATSQKLSTAKPKYDLIKNGCADDQTVKVEVNGRETSSSFSFNVFQFSGSAGEVFLHCKLQLCVKATGRCVPKCGGPVRKRRSAEYQSEDPAFISMAWTY